MMALSIIYITLIGVYTISVQYAAESVDEGFSLEKLMFEKLADLHVEIQRLKTDMQKLDKSFTSAVNNSAVIEGKITCKAPQVAFSAYNLRHLSPGAGQIFVFQNALLNIGHSYDITSGIFTAPIAGLYHFTAHACNAPNRHMVYSIFLDDFELAVSTTFDASTSTCGSVSALALVKVDQKVTVREPFGFSQAFQNVHRRASFIGMLVEATEY